MSGALRAAARTLRYAMPGKLGHLLPAPDAAWAARQRDRLARRGLASAIGYFQADDAGPAEIAAQNCAIAGRLAGWDSYLAVKAPPLGFDPVHLAAIAAAAREAGLPLVFDSHAPDLAQPTLDVVATLLDAHPGTGFALPARWRRSEGDAARFRDGSARIRLVKGEWPDPAWPDAQASENYLKLARLLAGRRAKVAVATHDPALAERALAILLAEGTPCELEQLRGLPRRRTTAVARSLGVPIRIYLPFGPGWWPYAIERALARPHLPLWALRDRFGARPLSPSASAAYRSS